MDVVILKLHWVSYPLNQLIVGEKQIMLRGETVTIHV